MLGNSVHSSMAERPKIPIRIKDRFNAALHNTSEALKSFEDHLGTRVQHKLEAKHSQASASTDDEMHHRNAPIPSSRSSTDVKLRRLVRRSGIVPAPATAPKARLHTGVLVRRLNAAQRPGELPGDGPREPALVLRRGRRFCIVVTELAGKSATFAALRSSVQGHDLLHGGSSLRSAGARDELHRLRLRDEANLALRLLAQERLSGTPQHVERGGCIYHDGSAQTVPVRLVGHLHEMEHRRGVQVVYHAVPVAIQDGVGIRRAVPLLSARRFHHGSHVVEDVLRGGCGCGHVVPEAPIDDRDAILPACEHPQVRLPHRLPLTRQHLAVLLPPLQGLRQDPSRGQRVAVAAVEVAAHILGSAPVVLPACHLATGQQPLCQAHSLEHPRVLQRISKPCCHAAAEHLGSWLELLATATGSNAIAPVHAAVAARERLKQSRHVAWSSDSRKHSGGRKDRAETQL
mmetsp:Transcript_92427/g.249353  ORF Transcript_92427/g.249353 Transcript_92427/m.249353 type:complete len:460 (+) Transcript_92427:195-1574(+)